MTRHIYSFQEAQKLDPGMRKSLLGGKGAGLSEMTAIGIPVPPGFTITTEACAYFHEHGNEYPPGLQEELPDAVARLETAVGRKLGDAKVPLLVSVRSGAAVSMPGMMDTVLNLGLNLKTRETLERASGSARFAWDAFRRFIQMFGNVVCGIEGREFEHTLQEIKRAHGVSQDTDLDHRALEETAMRYLELFRSHRKAEFPNDPWEQLRMAIDAVFDSWNNDRALKYRKLNRIRGLRGTAVNVQAMVFGNMGNTSGSGVCFTRDPSTGERLFYGEFLPNAQGEDVVAGTRTPLPIDQIDQHIPGIHAQLLAVREQLEKHYREMQDIEFTVENGRLFLLQTRTGKRTAAAALKIAVSMEREGLIDRTTAILRVDPRQLDQLLHPTFDPKARKQVVGKGLPASPGAATGKVCFSAEAAEAAGARGEAVILVRDETSPEDIGGMHASRGILTARGGMTSHAAVVARGMGKPCVAGCGELQIDLHAGTGQLRQFVFKEGAELSLDGATGEIMAGLVPTVPPTLSEEFRLLMSWADGVRRLKVRTNADTPADCRKAREFGAEGIGLCRTEHMFFEGDRIRSVREMILAKDRDGRRKALHKLLPMQKGDFVAIFQVMAGLPVTIRLLDPPLHEFLPMEPESQQEMAQTMGMPLSEIRRRVDQLRELNPMLGHRGCRLGISMPEIYEMQVRAILEAAHEVRHQGIEVLPEIMVPLVGMVRELQPIKEMILRVAGAIEVLEGTKVPFQVGTMIEVPRAALTADEIAREAEFFSFGTNDLTQMTFGFSRDDIGSFIHHYFERGILEEDPFTAIDIPGVGKLMRMAIADGRSTRPNLKIGICGESGGETTSVKFCHRIGMNYVSCSPFRVPVARLAAAHAALEENLQKTN